MAEIRESEEESTRGFVEKFESLEYATGISYPAGKKRSSFEGV